MKSTSVLLTTYPEAFLNKGGGEYELLEIANGLRQHGLIADVYSPYSKSIVHYDIVIHFSIHPSGFPIIETVKKAGKRLILWPNFWGKKKDMLQKNLFAAHFSEAADLIVFKSHIERRNFESIAPLNPEKVLIVPTVVDSIYTERTPPGFFHTAFGLSDYLLWIGIIEPEKNQLNVIQALRHSRMPVVFIGNYRDPDYYKACRNAAPEHFLFLDEIEQRSDLLRAAINESRVYIEPTLEPAGKSVLEAGISGARVVVTDAPWEREHMGDFAVYVRPRDIQSIREGVACALETGISPNQCATLAKRHLMPHVLDDFVNAIKRLSAAL